MTTRRSTGGKTPPNLHTPGCDKLYVVRKSQQYFRLDPRIIITYTSIFLALYDIQLNLFPVSDCHIKNTHCGIMHAYIPTIFKTYLNRYNEKPSGTSGFTFNNHYEWQ